MVLTHVQANPDGAPHLNDEGRQVAQSVERRTLEVEVRGSKSALGTWWWDRIPPKQPYPKGAAPGMRWRQPHYSQSGDPQLPGDDLI